MPVTQQIKDKLGSFMGRGEKTKVGEMMHHNLESISPNSSLKEAAALMKNDGIGALPVIENNRCLGFLTDRDIAIRAVAAGKNPETTKVADIMSAKLVTCPESCTLEEAARIMGENNVRRLLVVDSAKKPVGLVSLTDLAVKSPKSDAVYKTIKHLKEAQH